MNVCLRRISVSSAWELSQGRDTCQYTSKQTNFMSFLYISKVLNLCVVYIQCIPNACYRWQTANYTRFWNLTFTQGIKEHVGIETESKAQNMSSLYSYSRDELPVYFDARINWTSWIHPVRDQKNCASSWAFSTVGKSLTSGAAQGPGGDCNLYLQGKSIYKRTRIID